MLAQESMAGATLRDQTESAIVASNGKSNNDISGIGVPAEKLKMPHPHTYWDRLGQAWHHYMFITTPVLMSWKSQAKKLKSLI